MYGFVSWMVVINCECGLAGVDICMSECLETVVIWLHLKRGQTIGMLPELGQLVD